jgi:hypothetical protein
LKKTEVQKNYLLNIAIDNYTDPAFPPLNNAVSDAKKLEEILTTKYNFELILDSLINEEATRKSIIENLNQLSILTKENDNLIIHFAGHGSLHPKTEKGFWIPQNAENSISDFIPNSTLIDTILGIDAKHILLIIDSCFSGSLLSQTRASVGFHYSKLNESKSRWVLASGRNEKVSDGNPGSGSPFSIILNEFLKQNTDNTFSASELATAVTKGTGSVAKQQPIFAHIEGVDHKDGQMIFNLTKGTEDKSITELETNLSSIVLPIESALKIHNIGLTEKSIFGYYKKGDSFEIKIINPKNKSNFICNAYTFEEIVKYIPEHIEVDENTYIAHSTGYDKLGKPEQGTYDFANVTFQRTEVSSEPYMSICKCRGRMVAFSKSSDGYYNNLIRWGINQAESAGLMILALVEENKIEIKNGR